MASRTNKEKILAVIRSMPDEAIDRRYLLWKVERGLEQADAGEVTDHDEFMKGPIVVEQRYEHGLIREAHIDSDDDGPLDSVQ